jgi:2-polyprenyl-3-methyl-5-hydroxy-6-metoxy-1,4-benzoquinol methylase
VPDLHQETDNTAKYERAGRVEGALMGRFRRGLLEELAALAPASVLDAGCGEGHVTSWIAEAFPQARVAGVDGREDALAALRARTPRVEAARGDVYDLPFGDRTFDVVVCTEVLEHLEEPGRGLAELVRVAGRAVVLTVPHEPGFRLGNVARGRYLGRFGSTPGHVNTWGRRGFTRLVAAKAHVERWRSLFPWQLVVASTD